MSDTVGELTNRLHLLRLTKLLVDGAAFRHVAGDLGKPDQVAGLVVHGVDDYVRPEPRTILADTPTLRLDPAIPSRGHQHMPRQAVFLIRGAVKHGKMLTNNLFCPIALDTLGTGIPVGDDAFCIQHEDGVVYYTPDEKPEPAFALTKPRQGLRQLAGPFFDV